MPRSSPAAASSHGPTPRDYTQRTPKKMKAAALRGALSDRARAGAVHVVSSLVDGDAPSTKAARKVVEGLLAGCRGHDRAHPRCSRSSAATTA